jgi:hypothetical protein
MRNSVSHCRCKLDWSKYASKIVEEFELEVVRQIYRLCCLSEDVDITAEADTTNPLYKLDLKSFLAALVFVASQYGGIVDTTGKHLAPSKRSSELHLLFSKAFQVFNDWPNNFYSFLDWRREQRKDTRHTHGLLRDFGQYKSALYVQFSSCEFDFLRSAFEEYLTTHWKGGYASALKRIAKDDQHTKKYASRIEAQRILNTSTEVIEKLIVEGKLKAIVRNEGRLKLILIETAGLIKLKEEWQQTMSFRQVQKLLDLEAAHRVRDLIEHGLLNPLCEPIAAGCTNWKFRSGEVAALLERFKSKISATTPLSRNRTLSFFDTLRKLGRVGMSIGAFIQGVFNDELKPCGESRDPGLRGFLFSASDVSNYISLKLRLQVGDVLQIREVAEYLGIGVCAVHYLIRKKIIRAKIEPKVKAFGLLVEREELEHFTSTYLLLTEAIARKLITQQHYIARLLIAQGVNLVFGKNTTLKKPYVFKKSDLGHIDLAKLVSAAKAESIIKYRETSLVNLAEASKLLGLDEAVVLRLVENRLLKFYEPSSRKKKGRGECYFSAYAIKTYKSLGIDCTSLVWVRFAAKMIGLSVSHFHIRYIKTGRLVGTKICGRQYLRKKDVEKLVELKKQLIGSAKAAAILGVNITCIKKLTDSGLLKPASGPDVDGFGLNLYLRSDVEKLHTEREAFKAKRIKEGGTTRFGRQSGPKASPVQNVIGHRINQLIEKWHERTPDRRITGGQLYQQLSKEGYRIGINTVYVYLRQKHRRAA